jgi:hypothetical protein
MVFLLITNWHCETARIVADDPNPDKKLDGQQTKYPNGLTKS